MKTMYLVLIDFFQHCEISPLGQKDSFMSIYTVVKQGKHPLMIFKYFYELSDSLELHVFGILSLVFRILFSRIITCVRLACPV